MLQSKSYVNVFVCCYSSYSLVNRNFLTLKDFTNDEIKLFLWTAMDLKKRIKVQREVILLAISKLKTQS